MTAVALGAFWLIALFAFARGQRALLYLFFASIPFGSFAVLPPALTGGLTLTPLPITTLLIILRAVLDLPTLSGILRSVTTTGPQAILATFWVLAGFVTMFMPRIFAGSVVVVPVRAVDRGIAPLYPSTQNFSQFTYLSVSIIAVFVFAEIMKDDRLQRIVVRAAMFGSAIAILTGLLDMASQFLPLAPVLEAFRTATYTLHVDAEILGAKRVVGLMPEASSYGAICVSLLALIYFLRRTIDRNSLLRPIGAVLGLLLVLATYLSTSSAAYLGLGILVFLAVAEWAFGFATLPDGSGQRTILRRDLTLAMAGLLIVVAILLFQPSAFNRLMVLLDETLIQKSGSQSFEERGMWTRVAWQSAADTFGLGVGVGSARASNFWAALTSNVGYLGTLLYSWFLVTCYIARPADNSWRNAFTVSACKWALIPGMGVGIVIGTSADFGVINAFIYGLLLGVSRSRRPVDSPQRDRHLVLAS